MWIMASLSPFITCICCLCFLNLSGVRWHFKAVLICFSMMDKHVKHLKTIFIIVYFYLRLQYNYTISSLLFQLSKPSHITPPLLTFKPCPLQKRKEAVITMKPMVHTRCLRDAVKRDVQRIGKNHSKGNNGVIWMESIYYITQKRGWRVYPDFFRQVSLWSFEEQTQGKKKEGKKGKR